MLEWLALASSGITLATAGPTMHSYLSGFTLAKKVDLTQSVIEHLSGEIQQLCGEIKKISEKHYRSNNVGVLVGDSSIVSPSADRFIERPDVGENSYVTDHAIEIPNELRENFLNNPSDFLHGITEINEQVPDQSHLLDDTLIPWHFSEAGTSKIGFAKRGYLNHLGIIHRPLQDELKPAEVVIPETLNVPAEANKTEQSPLHLEYLKPNNSQRSFAKIKYFRGNVEFSGVHEYEVNCPVCSETSDLPHNSIGSLNVFHRCEKCNNVIDVAYIRTNMSGRYHSRYFEK